MAGDIKQNANMRIIDYFEHAINIMYPPICIICKSSCWISNILCKECWEKISFITRPFCKKCGTSLTTSSSMILCTDDFCINEKHCYNYTISIIEYNDFAKQIIKKFKFHAIFKLRKLLKNWLTYISATLECKDIDYIFPVPLHKSKLKLRGYNQSAIIAKIMADITKIKYNSKILVKIKNTANQSELSKNLREKNLKNSFYISENNRKLIQGKKILLIDDVITTGNTINECSKTLSQHGATEVIAISIARR